MQYSKLRVAVGGSLSNWKRRVGRQYLHDDGSSYYLASS